MKLFSRPSARQIAGRVSFSPFRIVAYILHATGLEYIYKPRFMRHTSVMDFNDEVVNRLPKHCFSLSGAKMDPMNVIFVGSDADIRRTFRKAGWHRANPASPLHLLYTLFTTIAKRPYRTGPFTPLFVNIGLQDLAYQKTLRDGTQRRRHHIRIWRTGLVLPGERRVWVAAGSFDTSLKVQVTPPFIHHAIDPNLDTERAYIVRELEKRGALYLKTVAMTEPVLASRMRSNGYGARYFTDGRAVVVEV